MKTFKQFDESERQDLATKLLNRELYCCMTQEVDFMLNQSYENDSPITFDDIKNYYPETSGDGEEEPPEIYEWWAVSVWLGEKLDNAAECVIESYGKTFWGRQCTGQAIKLDSVIQHIAVEYCQNW